jgi:hypothetical protein
MDINISDEATALKLCAAVHQRPLRHEAIDSIRANRLTKGEEQRGFSPSPYCLNLRSDSTGLILAALRFPSTMQGA